MSKRLISEVWGIEEEQDGDVATISCIGFVESDDVIDDDVIDDDVIDDDVIEDDVIDDEDEEYAIVDEEKCVIEYYEDKADVIEDEGEDDVIEDEIEEEEEEEEQYVEYEYYKVDKVDISKLKEGDGLLFPNICDEYYDTIRWLFNPEHDRDKPPLDILGIDPSDEVPEYVCGSHSGVQLGQQFDVLSLHWRFLRVGDGAGDGDGDYIKAETLKDKYVVFVCVFAPARWVEDSCRLLCQLRILSEELSDALNFEMVIVPKMRRNCEGHKAAFHALLSVFPGRLFVPFEDAETRDEICQRLNFRGTLKAVLVDTTLKVAQNNVLHIVSNCYYPSHNQNNNTHRLKYLSPCWIRPRSLSLYQMKENSLSFSLAQLLDSSYADPTLCLHSLSSTETITVAQLTNKLVGVYLFQVGDKLDSLLKVYSQCREKGLDFDIVVVCISLATSLDPLVFYTCAIDELKRRIPKTPWWVLPYNAATCASLWNLTMGLQKDAMITVGPSRKLFVDAYGGEVVHRYGIQAYPFNREMIVRKYELGAKAITLSSLLSHGHVDYVVRGGKQVVPVADLSDNKVVVLYTGWRLDYKGYTYQRLCKWYKEIRKQHSDFEVVFVYYDEPEGSNNEKHSSCGVDLLVRPFDPEHSSFLINHESFFMGDNGHGYPSDGVAPDSTLLFGKGGRLCSLNALLCFERYGLGGYPYETGCGDNYLRDEITYSLAFEFSDFMHNYRNRKPFDVVSLD